MGHRAASYLLVVSALLASLSCGSGPAERPNVILISLDQFRADRSHSYGNPRSTTPNLDRLAERGVRFSHFYSAAPWTTPSYGAIMTSQYPSKHGATLFAAPGMPGIRSGSAVLAELFHQAGYHTGAFVNNSVAGAFLTRPGFDEYDEPRRAQSIPPSSSPGDDEQWRAPATNQRIFHWLEAHAGPSKKPFFLFLLYFEPHSPYDPPTEDDLFRSGPYASESNTGYDIEKGRLFRRANLHDPAAIDRLTQLYDGKIHFIDRYIGELWSYLAAHDLDKNTIIWITSDHGELLYSHADDYMTFDHRSLYDTVMHVPSLILGPGIPRNKVIDGLATHIDIAPTLLALSGLAAKPNAQGVNLVPLLSGSAASAHEYLFGEQDLRERLRSVRDVRYKLILNEDTGKKQLFDTSADAEERTDLSSTQPGVVSRLSEALDKWRAANEPAFATLRERWSEAARRSAPVTIVDEVTIGGRFQLLGEGWKAADVSSAYGGGVYWTSATDKSGSAKGAIWRTDSPLIGTYQIALWYGNSPARPASRSARFEVASRNGRSRTFTIDQTKHTGGWQQLGEFVDPVFVRLTPGEQGVSIADAVRFERLRP